MAFPDMTLDAAMASVVVAVVALIGALVGHGVQYKLGKNKAAIDTLSSVVDDLQEQLKDAHAHNTVMAQRMDAMDTKLTNIRKELGDTRDENQRMREEQARLRAELDTALLKGDAAEAYIVELLKWGEGGAPPPPPARRRHINPE